jgi:hypothetical protein
VWKNERLFLRKIIGDHLVYSKHPSIFAIPYENEGQFFKSKKLILRLKTAPNSKMSRLQKKTSKKFWRIGKRD